jgi:hypothetical protein
MGFLCERSRGVVCCARSALGWLLFEIGAGGAIMRDREGGEGNGAVQEREREQEGGGVRGCNILENGLQKKIS